MGEPWTPADLRALYSGTPPLVIKVVDYRLVEVFCTFWVKFCKLCSVKFGVSFLISRFSVPVLSNNLPETALA